MDGAIDLLNANNALDLNNIRFQLMYSPHSLHSTPSTPSTPSTLPLHSLSLHTNSKSPPHSAVSKTP